MLVSRPKKNYSHSGDESLIYLVPELCRMTGLTDKMRNNFPLMQELAKHTRLVPSQRVERLQKFNSRLKTQSEVSLSN
jgi:aubergine-like protein